MPTLHVVQAALQEAVAAVMTNITALYISPGKDPVTLPISVMTGIGWPSVQMLQKNVKGASAVVSIYDRKMSRNSTRWNPLILSDVVTPAALTSQLSQSTLNPGQSLNLILGTSNQSGLVNAGDAVSLIVTNRAAEPTQVTGKISLDDGTGNIGLDGGGAILQDNPSGPYIWTPQTAVVATGVATDTPQTIAQQLAALINAKSDLSSWISVQVMGSQLTITNKSTSGVILLDDGSGAIALDDGTGNIGLDGPLYDLKLQTFVGNGGTRTTEIGRRDRLFQIVIWTPTEEIRQAIGDPIELLIAQMQNDFGITFPDGTMGRVMYQDDYDCEDDTFQDAYRRDFLFSVEYGITTQDALYSVLAPIAQYQIN